MYLNAPCRPLLRHCGPAYIAGCTCCLPSPRSPQITAVLAWRQFGWRLYGKLGVDFREKGAASRMRKALQRNAYVTVLKINVMFLVRRCGWLARECLFAMQKVLFMLHGALLL